MAGFAMQKVKTEVFEAEGNTCEVPKLKEDCSLKQLDLVGIEHRFQWELEMLGKDEIALVKQRSEKVSCF